MIFYIQNGNELEFDLRNSGHQLNWNIYLNKRFVAERPENVQIWIGAIELVVHACSCCNTHSEAESSAYTLTKKRYMAKRFSRDGLISEPCRGISFAAAPSPYLGKSRPNKHLSYLVLGDRCQRSPETLTWTSEIVTVNRAKRGQA